MNIQEYDAKIETYYRYYKLAQDIGKDKNAKVLRTGASKLESVSGEMCAKWLLWKYDAQKRGVLDKNEGKETREINAFIDQLEKISAETCYKSDTAEDTSLTVLYRNTTTLIDSAIMTLKHIKSLEDK